MNLQQSEIIHVFVHMRPWKTVAVSLQKCCTNVALVTLGCIKGLTPQCVFVENCTKTTKMPEKLSEPLTFWWKKALDWEVEFGWFVHLENSCSEIKIKMHRCSLNPKCFCNKVVKRCLLSGAFHWEQSHIRAESLIANASDPRYVYSYWREYCSQQQLMITIFM